MEQPTSLDEVLAHYGVKGMHWGVRRSEAQLAKSSKSTDSEDATTAKAAASKAKSHGTDSLSNKELQSLVNRMNLEQQYSKLNSKSSDHSSSLKSQGSKFAKDLLVNVAKQQVTKIANDYAYKQFAELMNNK